MDYSKAYELKQQGVELKEIMQKLNISMNYKAFQKALWRYENNTPIEKNGILYEDKKEVPTELDIQECYDKLKELECSLNILDTKQTKTTVTMQDNKPVAIAFWGDWHIGARGIDYEQFDKDRETINNTEGLYFIGMGDYKDNQSPLIHKATNESVISQGIQDMLVQNFFKEVGEKAIAIIRGCHDDWDKKIGDKDFIQTLCEDTNSVNLWHGGKININLGSQQYKIYARHKYKNESSLNTTNAQRNMLNDAGAVDVAALGHKHFPDMQMLDRMGGKVVYLRSGSYKKYDEFGQKLAGYEGKKSIPVIVLYPGEHKIVPFQELEDAITYLKAVRG